MPAKGSGAHGPLVVELVDALIDDGGAIARTVAEVLGRVSCWDGYWVVECTDEGVRDIALAPGNVFVPRHFGPNEIRRLRAPAAAWTTA